MNSVTGALAKSTFLDRFFSKDARAAASAAAARVERDLVVTPQRINNIPPQHDKKHTTTHRGVATP